MKGSGFEVTFLGFGLGLWDEIGVLGWRLGGFSCFRVEVFGVGTRVYGFGPGSCFVASASWV